MTQPVVSVAVAFGIPPLSTPAGGDWIDISTYVRQFSWARGRNHELTRTNPGTLEIRLRNTDRRFDPSNVAGPYYPNLKPMTRVRVQATHNAITYNLFQGYVEDWGQEWAPRPLGNNGDAECVVRVTDAFKILALSTLTAFPDEVLADSPIGYWRLNEAAGTATALDTAGATGGPYNGTYEGSPSLGSVAGPLPGGSTVMDADGTNDRVDVGDPAALHLSDDLTIELWFKPDTTPAAGRTLTEDNPFWAITYNASNHVHWLGQIHGSARNIEPTSTFATGVWHHLVVVRKGGDVLFYKNGVDISAGATITDGATVTPNGMRIGSDIGESVFFDGKIAHVAVYDHALTPERIAAHYRANVDTFIQQLSGAHINAVLDAIGWPAGERTIDGGDSMIQQVTPSGSVLDQLLSVAEDTEQGLLQAAGDGKILFHERTALFSPPHTVSQATFGDGETDVSTISGLVAWWKADALALADLTPVSTWVDSSGHGNDLTQPTGGLQPTYSANRGPGGLPLVIFDGTDDRMGATTNITSAPISIFIVCYKVAVQSGSRVIVQTQKLQVQARTAGADAWRALGTGGPSSGQAVNGPPWRLLEMISRSATDTDLRTDGGNFVNGSLTAYQANAGTVVGSAGSGVDPTAVAIAEILVYNREVTDVERRKIESYLADKWGLAGVNLAFELPYADLVLTNDDEDLWNDIRVTRDGGVPQSARDTTSITSYGPRTLDRTGLLLALDSDAYSSAGYLLYRYKDPLTRPSELKLLGASDDQRLVQMLARETHHDRITIVRRPPGGGDAITLDAHIEGLSHVVTPGQSWESIWSLIPADRFNYWILEDPGYGVLDNTTRLAY